MECPTNQSYSLSLSPHQINPVHVDGSSKNCTLMILILQSIKVGVAFCLCALIIYYMQANIDMQVNYVATHSQVRTAICIPLSEAIKICFKNIRYRFYLSHPHMLIGSGRNRGAAAEVDAIGDPGAATEADAIGEQLKRRAAAEADPIGEQQLCRESCPAPDYSHRKTRGK